MLVYASLLPPGTPMSFKRPRSERELMEVVSEHLDLERKDLDYDPWERKGKRMRGLSQTFRFFCEKCRETSTEIGSWTETEERRTYICRSCCKEDPRGQ